MSRRRLPVGAELIDGGAHFRVWAPGAARIEVVLERAGARPEPRVMRLERSDGGYHAGLVAGARAGDRYRYRIDGGDALPDPASRFQPEGPHGPSQLVDPAAFSWTDAAFPGAPSRGRVLYEMHVGTFTPEGTWAAAQRELPYLADLGVTVVEMMPVNDFSGRFGWGYDGVDLFAPTRLYGTPDDLRRFVDRAHALGIAVILDVVYNHLGPDGNYLRRFAGAYFSTVHTTDWGDALNFDGEDSGPVRELFLANVRYWIDELHFDGLRIDATQDVHDRWDDHILARMVDEARAAGGRRAVLIVGENEPQDRRLLAPRAEGGGGFDALWNDDFHHTAMVAATGRREAYYQDYRGTPQELISALRWGFLYQGFAASAPFLYFADHDDRLGPLVCRGRAEFLKQFPSMASDEVQEALPDPCAVETFERCKLDHREREANAPWLALHRDLLALRRADPVLSAERADRMHGAVLGPEALALRFLDADHGDRLLLVNLGHDLDLVPAPEPLLAPPPGGSWEVVLSTENPAYGGSGTPPIQLGGAWKLPGRAAVVLSARAPGAAGGGAA